MKYKVESIGAEFSDKAISALEKRFESKASEGYKFHSVFQVTKSSCMSFGQATTTNLAVYVQE